MRWFPIVSGLAVSLALGCTGPELDPTPLMVGPMASFRADIQPALTERCASGGCHGRPDRPLSLFAPGAFRADPSATYLDEPLTDDEVFENALRLAGFAHERDARTSILVCKPLAVDAGGCHHDGGDVFADDTDPLLRSLETWLAGRAPIDGGAP